MNERIKELIKQHSINITIDGLGYGEGNVEGLAELIVRECLRVIQMESREYSGPDCEDGLLIAQGALKEHFGVEE